jgi:hypothetical protein
MAIDPHSTTSSNGLEEVMIRANCTAVARLGGSSAACQCAMQMVFNTMHCVTRKAARQQLQWHWHADGDVDGLLRWRRLEQHVHRCRAPLRRSLAMSRTALGCSQRGTSHGRSDDIIGRRHTAMPQNRVFLTPKQIPFFEPYAWSTRDVFHSLPGAAPCIHATWGISRHHDASLVGRWGDGDHACFHTTVRHYSHYPGHTFFGL